MPSSAFFAVFRNVAKLAAAAADDVAAQGLKLAAAADDVALMTGRAAAKTAGIAADDLAVGASKMTGVFASTRGGSASSLTPLSESSELAVGFTCPHPPPPMDGWR